MQQELEESDIENNFEPIAIPSAMLQPQARMPIKTEYLSKKSNNVQVNQNVICSLCKGVLRHPCKFCKICNSELACEICIYYKYVELKSCPFSNQCHNDKWSNFSEINMYNNPYYATINLSLNQLVFDCPGVNNTQNLKCQETGLFYQEFIKHIQKCLLIELPCPNSNQGCSIRTTKKNEQSHQIECELALVNCTFCQKKYIRKNLIEHIQVCSEKLPCQYCSDYYALHRKMEHDNICPYLPVNCSGCTKSVQKQDLAAHERDCPEVIESCICGSQIKRKDRFNHKQDICYKNTLSKFRQMTKQIRQDNQNNIRAQQEKNLFLSNSLQQLNEQIAQMQQKLH